MKITIEIGDKNARLIGKFLFGLGGFFVLMALISVVTIPSIVFPLIFIVFGGILMFSGFFLMVKK